MKRAILSVTGLVLAAGLSLPAQAEISAELKEQIRIQGEWAMQSIEADARYELQLQASTLDNPWVKLGPIELVSEAAKNETSALDQAGANLDLWVKTLLASGERDLYRALSLARLITIDVTIE